MNLSVSASGYWDRYKTRLQDKIPHRILAHVACGALFGVGVAVFSGGGAIVPIVVSTGTYWGVVSIIHAVIRPLMVWGPSESFFDMGQMGATFIASILSAYLTPSVVSLVGIRVSFNISKNFHWIVLWSGLSGVNPNRQIRV